MLRIITCLLIILGIGLYPQFCNAEQHEQNHIKIRYKKYKKNKKDIKKQDFIRTKKQKELEYLEKRLETKKKRLENLTVDQAKGEKE